MPTEDNKQLAKFMAGVLSGDGKPKVIEYNNNDSSLKIPIMICPDSPWNGFTAYSSIGLSDYTMYKNGEEYPVRLEIVGVANSSCKYLPNIIADLSFSLMKRGLLYYPGLVFCDLISNYDKLSKFKHVFFTDPFIWEELDPQYIGSKKVAWLLVFPITNDEDEYIRQNGADEFEKILEDRQINACDIERSTIGRYN